MRETDPWSTNDGGCRCRPLRGLFAVTRARVLSRPRAFYERLAAELNGVERPTCDGADTRALGTVSKKARRSVGDCHLLEKLWHVLFGEPAELPPPRAYNPLRAPGLACPLSTRVVEDDKVGNRPEDRCRGQLETLENSTVRHGEASRAALSRRLARALCAS